MGELFADIVLPVAAPGTFTYRVPERLEALLKPGSGVLVRFGRRKEVAGVVARIHSNAPVGMKTRDIDGLTGAEHLAGEVQLKLWNWIAEYYMCTPGEVMNAAIPSSLLGSTIPSKTTNAVLLAQGNDHQHIDNLRRRFQGSPAKMRLLDASLELSVNSMGADSAGVEKSILLARAKTSATTLNQMVDEGIFTIEQREVTSMDTIPFEPAELSLLNDEQDAALRRIEKLFGSTSVALLKGVTSSGKTEIYFHLIAQTIAKGKQALYLLPEIALTSQMINRLRNHFGEDVGVYHSGLTEIQRAEVWRRTAGVSGQPPFRVILGVRSSLFLPFTRLGLVIVDEEHEGSYKQSDPAPRYHARDTAIMLARFHGAPTLLGSATPSIETMYNASTGKYGYAELNRRFGDVKMPSMILADIRQAYKRKEMVSHFTPALVDAVREALSKGEQVVLFRNRRGFSSLIRCSSCGWVPGCPSCSVALTYHKGLNRMRCHYCGRSQMVPDECPECGSTALITVGFGTEKIEDELKILFPDARVARMDLDTTRRRGSMEKIIRDMEKGKTDIVTGTQMISKGLDFENLTVVGILNVDNMLFFPDFRSHERCFQMIEQVSGRSGRRTKQGKVILQTWDPGHLVMKQALAHDYASMYHMQLAERDEFRYPPFTRLIRIYLKHQDRDRVTGAAADLASRLRKRSGFMVLGPEAPMVARRETLNILSILIKIERSGSPAAVKRIITDAVTSLIHGGRWKGVRVFPDVDPL
jgi:primosomal protein N' (replication factor Y)